MSTKVQPQTAPHKTRLLTPALVAICLGFFVVIMDTTIVNVALPAMRQDLHTTLSELQWVVDGYTLTFAAMLLTGGALSDRLGARRVFQLGMAGFVLSSVGCAAAPAAEALVGARLVQGCAAALLVPSSLALLRTNYPDPSTRARAIGVWGGISGIGAAAGPVLGGLLVSSLSWRWVFMVNAPIGLITAFLTYRYVKTSMPQKRDLDLCGQLTGVLALSALTWALIEVIHTGIGPAVIAAGAISLGGFGAFVLIEFRVRTPMLSMTLFSHPVFSAGTAIGFLINLGFYGELFATSIYFQRELGYSALLTGVALLPQGSAIAIGALLSGRFTSRMGSPAPTMVIGLTVGAVGLAGLVIAGTHTSYLELVAPITAAGFGISFTMPAATSAVVDNSPAESAGVASAAVNTARQIGGVVGIALLGGLVGDDAFSIAGLRLAAVLAGSVFCIGAVVAALLFVRERRSRSQPAG